jgi:hypothetical protein
VGVIARLTTMIQSDREALLGHNAARLLQL